MKYKLILLTATLMFSLLSFAQQKNTTYKASADALQPKLAEWRRHLHEHPELSNREFETSKYIIAHLQKLGLEIQTGVAKTGVVAILKGGKPGPCVALRADMDALPVKERVNIAYASKDSAEYMGQKVAVMHACGHDTHVAMLMGAAEILSGMKKDIAGTGNFIFQPAEEGAPGTEEGGAALMVKEGVMENPKVDAVFGMHISSSLEVGKLEYKPGAFMASADWFTIKIKGKSSHGSQPWLGVDPILVGAQITEGLQNIVSRQMDLTHAPVVITVGKFHSGVRQNIIPEECLLEGTIRTLDTKMQQDVYKRIKQTAEKIAEANNATAIVSFENKTLVTYNTPELVKQMLPSLQAAAGKDNVLEAEWKTGAEDFSFYGTKAPSFFFYIGGMPIGTDKTKAPPHHTPDFYVDDSQLNVGVKAFCQLVLDYRKM